MRRRLVLPAILCAVVLLCGWSQPGKERLTLERAVEIVRGGRRVAWQDFDAYECEEIGGGARVRRFALDGGYALVLYGDSEQIACVRLVSGENPSSYMNLQTEDLDAFLAWDHRIGRFSYAQEVGGREAGQIGVNPYPFRNVEPSPVSDFDGAIDRAKGECTIQWNAAFVDYDRDADVWQVTFYTEGMLGGDQSVYMGGDGITRLIVYGE